MIKNGDNVEAHQARAFIPFMSLSVVTSAIPVGQRVVQLAENW